MWRTPHPIAGDQPSRSATFGSTRPARRAGTNDARTATASRSAGTPANTEGGMHGSAAKQTEADGSTRGENRKETARTGADLNPGTALWTTLSGFESLPPSQSSHSPATTYAAVPGDDAPFEGPRCSAAVRITATFVFSVNYSGRRHQHDLRSSQSETSLRRFVRVLSVN